MKAVGTKPCYGFFIPIGAPRSFATSEIDSLIVTLLVFKIASISSIACVETVENMQFGAMIFPIRLTPDRWGGNITAVMAGFGQTQEEPRTDVKQYLEMETLSNADCRRAFDSSPFDAVRVFDSNICLSNPGEFFANFMKFKLT